MENNSVHKANTSIGKTQGLYLIRDASDHYNFIGRLLKDHYGKGKSITNEALRATESGMVVHTTISKQYTVDDFRMIEATPSHVLASYELDFINDQVTVKVKTIKYTSRTS